MNKFLKINKKAFIGGLITAFTIAVGVFVLGNISGYEAKKLINLSIQGLNMICNTIILASATILTLLLTLLGLSTGIESKLKDQHYIQVLDIAKIVTILFISTLVLFQFFNIPITEADNIDVQWFKYIYWATLIASSLVSGLMVTTILMLYSTVTNMISIVGLGDTNHQLLIKEEDEELEDEKLDS